MPCPNSEFAPPVGELGALPELNLLCTQELLLLLEQTPQLDVVLEKYKDSIGTTHFSEYLCALLAQRSIDVGRLGGLSMLSQSFAYQLCNGTRLPSRDIALRLALALALTVDEAQRLLLIAQRGALYPKVRRDAVVIFALSHRLGLSRADELLRQLGEIPLL